MKVHLCGIQLEHPVLNGSGTFDAIAARRAFGDALLERFPFAAFVSKTITPEPRAGNPPPREYTVERCDTRYSEHWEERVDGYRVTYVYNGHRQVSQMPYKPGDRIRVRVDVSPAE